MSNLKYAMQRIKAVSDTLDDNDPDKIEMLNVEGDYSKLMDWAIEKYALSVNDADATKNMIDKYQKRKKMFENKAENMKGIVQILLSCANEKSYKGVAGTVSLRTNAPKPIIQDESKIPDDYFEHKKVLRKSDINKAIKDGYSIDGVVMDNGGQSIMIRI